MRAKIAAALFVVTTTTTLAQPVPQVGPPIPPDVIFRAQPTAPPPMPKSLPSPPPLTSRSSNDYRALPPATPDVDHARDRVSRCQHEAAVRGVRKSKRGAYVHACAYGR